MSRQLGLKKARKDGKTKSAPLWKRRSRGSIKELNRITNSLTRHKNGEVEIIKEG